MAVYPDVYEIIGNYLGISAATAVVLFAIISIWSLVWKGFALWKSSKKNHLVWFIVLLIVNTIGILEILYIFIFSKMSLKGKGKPAKSVKEAVKLIEKKTVKPAKAVRKNNFYFI